MREPAELQNAIQELVQRTGNLPTVRELQPFAGCSTSAATQALRDFKVDHPEQRRRRGPTVSRGEQRSGSVSRPETAGNAGPILHRATERATLEAASKRVVATIEKFAARFSHNEADAALLCDLFGRWTGAVAHRTVEQNCAKRSIEQANARASQAMHAEIEAAQIFFTRIEYTGPAKQKQEIAPLHIEPESQSMEEKSENNPPHAGSDGSSSTPKDSSRTANSLPQARAPSPRQTSLFETDEHA